MKWQSQSQHYVTLQNPDSGNLVEVPLSELLSVLESVSPHMLAKITRSHSLGTRCFNQTELKQECLD